MSDAQSQLPKTKQQNETRLTYLPLLHTVMSQFCISWYNWSGFSFTSWQLLCLFKILRSTCRMEMKCTKSLGYLSGKAMAVSAGLWETSVPLPTYEKWTKKVGWTSSLTRLPLIGKQAHFRSWTAHKYVGTSQAAGKMSHVCWQCNNRTKALQLSNWNFTELMGLVECTQFSQKSLTLLNAGMKC